MSERAVMAGDEGPSKTIEHNGRTYEFRPVITEGVMLLLEEKLYAKAVAGVAAQREVLSQERYEAKLDELLARYESGYYSFESEHTREFLRTQKGALTLAVCLADCTEGELFVLMTERTADVQNVLKAAMTLSMPKESKKSRAASKRR
jgi:hypothetical protein